jgi:Tol biopolymer transport system component
MTGYRQTETIKSKTVCLIGGHCCQKRLRWGGVVALAACLLSSCSHRPPLTSEHQLTNMVGVATSPVLSRDGATLVFAARPASHSNPQIWMMRLDKTGSPTPLTSDAAQNYDPELTPDGQSVLYTSSRAPPGIYRVPVSGGSSELVVEGGLAVKVSPDGKTLLYGRGLALARQAIEGGPSTPVLAAVQNSYAPAWAPDGSQIMVTAKDRADSHPEWWIVPLAGGEPHKTGIVSELQNQGFNSAYLNAWLPGDWIVFSGMQGETMTLWKIQLGPDRRIQGRALRATEESQGDYGATYAAGKLVYSRTRVDMNFWALPLDNTGWRVSGPAQPLTSGPARKGQESVGGSKLLYSAENGDRFSLVLKDFTSGREKLLRDAFFSLLSPDGSHYIYGDGTIDQLTLLRKSTGWWPFWSSRVCQNCGMPRGFSPEGKRLLLWTNSAPLHHLDMLNLDSGQINQITSSEQDLISPNLSSDGDWVTFVAKVGEHGWQTFAALVSSGKPLHSFDWIPVTPLSDSFHFAFWSERGDIVYNLTARGGSGNLKWLEAQRVDPASKHPIGVPQLLYEFGDMLVPGMDSVWNPVAVNGGKIILELGNIGTNIWAKDLK